MIPWTLILTVGLKLVGAWVDKKGRDVKQKHAFWKFIEALDKERYSSKSLSKEYDKALARLKESPKK